MIPKRLKRFDTPRLCTTRPHETLLQVEMRSGDICICMRRRLFLRSQLLRFTKHMAMDFESPARKWTPCFASRHRLQTVANALSLSAWCRLAPSLDCVGANHPNPFHSIKFRRHVFPLPYKDSTRSKRAPPTQSPITPWRVYRSAPIKPRHQKGTLRKAP